MSVIFMPIALITFLIVGFYVYYYLISPNMKIKINEGNGEIEKNNPPRKGTESNLAFGVILNSYEPNRSLMMKSKVENIKTYILENSWEIKNGNDARNVLNNLRDKGHRDGIDLQAILSDKKNLSSDLGPALAEISKDIKIPFDEVMKTKYVDAWDIERLASVARYSFYASYITEDECYSYLESAYKMAVEKFHSWTDYSLSFLIGRSICYDPKKLGQWTIVIRSLLDTEDSVWNENKNIWN